MALELVTRAAAIAAEAHVEQTRKGNREPYVNHVLRVAHQVAQAGLPAEAIAAALLHDVVEDTRVTLDDLREHFPERVIRLVELLTKWWPDDAPAELKRAGNPVYYGAILGDREAIAIKLLDRADNLQDMARMLPRKRDWAERYLAKTERELEPLYQASDSHYAREQYAAALVSLREALRKTSQRRS